MSEINIFYLASIEFINVSASCQCAHPVCYYNQVAFDL